MSTTNYILGLLKKVNKKSTNFSYLNSADPSTWCSRPRRARAWAPSPRPLFLPLLVASPSPPSPFSQGFCWSPAPEFQEHAWFRSVKPLGRDYPEGRTWRRVCFQEFCPIHRAWTWCGVGFWFWGRRSCRNRAGGCSWWSILGFGWWVLLLPLVRSWSLERNKTKIQTNSFACFQQVVKFDRVGD